MITRAAGGAPRLDLSIEAGSYSTARITGGLQGSGRGTRYALGFDYLDTDNISAADARAGNTERDGFRNAAIDGRIGHRFDSGLDLEAFATWSNGRTHFDGFDFALGPIDDPTALSDSRSLFAAARAGYAAGLWSGQATLSTSDTRLDTETPDGFNTASVVETTVNEIDFQNELRFDDNNTTVAGLEYRQESARSSAESFFGTSGFDEKIDVLGLYAQHRFSWGDRLHLSGGVRAEEHEKFGGKTTYRFTAAYVPATGVRLHGSLGTGFRAPTFNELYFPGFGNPALGPEASTGWDLGVGGNWLDGRLEIDATYFRNDLDGLIEFTFPAGFVNLGQAQTRGLEVNLGSLPHRKVRIDANYTFTDAHALGSDEQLLRRPRHQGAVMVRVAPRPDVSFFTELRYKGARNDFGTVAPVELPSYVVFNATAQARLTGDFEAIGRIDNIFDARYQDVWGYGTPGVSGYLGLRYRWPSGR